MGLSLKLNIIVIICFTLLVGCNNPSLSAKEVNNILKENQYNSNVLRLSQAFAKDQRPWICLCEKLGSDNEYAVIIKPSKEIVEVELGVNNRLSFNEMKKKLIDDGVVSESNFDDLNLFININQDDEVHWYYYDKENNKHYNYNLNGLSITE